MTYVDTTLTVQGGYTNINHGQIYTTLATAMTANGNWEYLEFMDAISGGTTYRRYVWRCKAAGSGLGADFYVVFEVPFTTSTGLFLTTTQIRVWIAAGYTGGSGVLSKFGTDPQSGITIADDMTNPATFTLTTYNLSGGMVQLNYCNNFGTTSNVTTMRIIFAVLNDALIITRAGAYGALAPSTNYTLYVGAYERILSATDDPMPLVALACSAGNTGSCGVFTHVPLSTPGTVTTDTFYAHSNNECLPNPTSNSGPGRIPAANLVGTVGAPATTTYWKNLGPAVAKCPVNTWLSAATNAATKGVLRGYMKGILCGNLPAHAYGDTFHVEGVTYAGIGVSGNAPLINTQL